MWKPTGGKDIFALGLKRQNVNSAGHQLRKCNREKTFTESFRCEALCHGMEATHTARRLSDDAMCSKTLAIKQHYGVFLPSVIVSKSFYTIHWLVMGRMASLS